MINIYLNRVIPLTKIFTKIPFSMEISYWQSRWRKDKTGWHLNKVYPLLPKFWPSLTLKAGAQVLVPLCGKSLDMRWFVEEGFKVTGIEASEKALHEFMNNYPGLFVSRQKYGCSIFRSEDIELWQGNFLSLPPKALPSFDAVYDKAALVALPKQMRKVYAQKVLECCNSGTQILLQSFEYNQDEMGGPPFSVDEQEIQQLYGDQFELTLLYKESKIELLNKFQRRGLSSYFNENIYHLKPK